MKRKSVVVAVIFVLISLFTESVYAITNTASADDYIGTENQSNFAFLPTPSSYSDGSLSLVDYDAGCVNWKVNSLSGNVVTENTYQGKLQFLLIFRASGLCWNSNDTIKRIVSKSWVMDERIKVIAIGMGEKNESIDSVKQHVEAFKSECAPNDTAIDFCYATNSDCWSIIKSYNSAIGDTGSNSISFVVHYVTDPDLNFRYTWQGEYNEANYSTALKLIDSGSESDPDPDWSRSELYGIKIGGANAYGEAYKVLDSLNQHRAEHGLSPLIMDTDLLDTAMKRAAEIALYYNHTRPNGTNFSTLFPDKFKYGISGENIAIGFSTAVDVMNAWKKSTPHNTNMLTPEYKSVGIGCFISNDGYVSWVQNFSSGEPTEAIVRNDTVPNVASFNAEKDKLALKCYADCDLTKLRVGDTAEVYMRCQNTEFPYTEPIVYLNYCFSDNPEVLSTEISENGTAVLKAKSVGTAKVAVGLINAAGIPLQQTVTLDISDAYTIADVNDDGEVTLDDAVLTLQKAMKVDMGSALFIAQAADVNGDGEISLDDAVEILKVAMKVNS